MYTVSQTTDVLHLVYEALILSSLKIVEPTLHASHVRWTNLLPSRLHFFKLVSLMIVKLQSKK